MSTKPGKDTVYDFSHELTLAPAFHDFDPMDVVWHGNYLKYLELARCALLAKYGYDYPQMRDSGYAWPVVDVRLKYIKPITYGQTIMIRAEIVEWENRLKINYLIRDIKTGHIINKASTIQVAIDMATKEMRYVSPRVLLDCLGLLPE